MEQHIVFLEDTITRFNPPHILSQSLASREQSKAQWATVLQRIASIRSLNQTLLLAFLSVSSAFWKAKNLDRGLRRPPSLQCSEGEVGFFNFSDQNG